MKITLLSIIIFFLKFSLYAQSSYELREKYKKERVYNFCRIDSTERYFIAKTIVDRDSVVLVIDKLSTQLKGKELKKGAVYTLNTYTIYDIISPSSANYCQIVDNQEVWCEGDNESLHFTDGMGNEYRDD